MSWQINKSTGEKEVKPASCDKPETWMSFEDAVTLFKSSKKYKGLSIALSPEPVNGETPRLVGIDLDKAVLPDGSVKPEKLEEIKSFNSYAEFSPTVDEGGLRAFCYGSFPLWEGVHAGDTEIYQFCKFLTVTGHKIKDSPSTIENAQEAISAFRAKYFKPLSSIDESSMSVTSVKLTDEQLLSNLQNYGLSDQFKDLFYKGAKEGDDHSLKDKDLCKLLVFWTQDIEQIDRVFRRSKLFRPEKWDKIHGHNEKGPLTYGQMTINYALKTRKNVYSPTGKGPLPDQNDYSLSIYPFSVSEEGITKTSYLYHKYSGDTEKIVETIATTPCIITAIGENIDNGEILYKLKIKDNKHRERVIWKTTSNLMKKTDVTKLLKEGMHFRETKANDIIDYFDKCITLYRDTFPSEVAASVSGWKSNFTLFVVGNRGISTNGEMEVLQQENPTAELYTQKGELDKWVSAINKLIKYNSVRFKLYTACVPPLLKLLNIKSFVETQQTPSGQLKTTTELLAASMWGDPERLILNADSTSAGIQKTVEFCTDLPIFVDETSITDRIKDMVYLIANGVGRSKSNSEGGLVMPSTWSTVVLTTGEKPILPESALMGQQVRVVPLRDGVKDKLPALKVKEIQNAITTNYGHIGILFLQELFKEKENLNSLFNAFFNDFPEVEDITSDRAKEFYAAIALAGYLLERVFQNIGVDSRSSIDVCKHYFTENVISNIFVPDHIKALSAAYSWFSANEIYFQEEDLNHERYGWIKDNCVCFNPEKLKQYLNTSIGPNTYEAVTEEWKILEILVHRLQKDSKTSAITKLKTARISTPSGKKSVIKIPFAKFNEYLKLEEDIDHTSNLFSNNDPKDSNRPQAPTIKQVSFKTPYVSRKIVTSIDALETIAVITTQANNTADQADKTADSIIVASDDAELSDIMKQEGFL